MSAPSPPAKRIQAEMIVGISAVLIGVCALFVSFYETRLMREQQRSAVLPILELSRSHYINQLDADPDKWRLSLQAENVGIGPARILDFHVRVDGKAHRTWQSAMQALLGVESKIRYGQSSINGRTIPPDRMVTMFDLSETKYANDIVAEFDRLSYSACYCSVFDECWITRYSDLGSSEPIATCSRDAESFEE